MERSEKLKLFSKIDAADFPQGDKVQQIWKDISAIHNLLCSTTTKGSKQINPLTVRTALWRFGLISSYGSNRTII